MTVEQRAKIQKAIEALIDVESALHADLATSPDLEAVQERLHSARTSLIELNSPDYN